MIPPTADHHGDMVRKGFPDAVANKEGNRMLDADAVAETFWQLHCQPRSAWSFEVDVRPYCERF